MNIDKVGKRDKTKKNNFNFFKKKFFLVVFFSLIIMSVFVLMLYQNCSEVSLKRVEKSLPKAIKGHFCTSSSSNAIDYSFELLHFFVINLTAKKEKDKLVADSDIDGLSDDFEDQYDFLNPIKRRTNGILLDFFCLSLGGGVNCDITDCNNQPFAFGLTECDIDILKSTSSFDINGIDTDEDLIPDLVEIIKGTNLLLADANDNNDNDSTLNIYEILENRDINFDDDDLEARELVIYDLEPKDISVSNFFCYPKQELFYFKIINLPLIPTKAFIDDKPLTSDLNLSHETNENIIALFVLSEPDNTIAVDKELYVKLFKISYDNLGVNIEINPDDFILLNDFKK